MKKETCFVIFLLLALNAFTQYVGIGNNTPASGLDMRGTGAGAQQRITDAVSGNTLVLQGGVGNNLKITGYNYNTGIAQPLYLSVDGANTILNSNGGNVGIGTTTPTTKLTVQSSLYGIEQTNGTVRLGTYLSLGAGWLGTITNHPLQFFTNNGEAQVMLNQAGQLSIGTISPTPGYLLQVAGPILNLGATSTHTITQTTGGTNSWARNYFRTPSQSWYMGSSQNFNGNQLYIADETFGNQHRISIQPNGGPLYLSGNIQQPETNYGIPKAMLYINGDGTIIRCHNSISNSSSGGCGFTVTRGGSGSYAVSWPFSTANRFIYGMVQDLSGIDSRMGISFQPANGYTSISVYNNDTDANEDRPFMMIIY